MPELKSAITVVGIILAVAASMALGDYLGYKLSRRRLAMIIGLFCFASVVVFTIYSAIVLLSKENIV